MAALVLAALYVVGVTSQGLEPAQGYQHRSQPNLLAQFVKQYLADLENPEPTKKGPVLFPNDGPPRPPPPLVVTSRPLAESIARSELGANNSNFRPLYNIPGPPFHNQATDTNIPRPKPRFVPKRPHKQNIDQNYDQRIADGADESGDEKRDDNDDGTESDDDHDIKYHDRNDFDRNDRYSEIEHREFESANALAEPTYNRENTVQYGDLNYNFKPYPSPVYETEDLSGENVEEDPLINGKNYDTNSLDTYDQQKRPLPPIFNVLGDYVRRNRFRRPKPTDYDDSLQNHGADVDNVVSHPQQSETDSREITDENGKRYAFSYSVRDRDTGDDFSHKQRSSGSATDGEYRVRLPDGRLQIVSYTADEGGYKADVRYTDEDNPIENQPQPHQPKNHYTVEYPESSKEADNLENQLPDTVSHLPVTDGFNDQNTNVVQVKTNRLPERILQLVKKPGFGTIVVPNRSNYDQDDNTVLVTPKPYPRQNQNYDDHAVLVTPKTFLRPTVAPFSFSSPNSVKLVPNIAVSTIKPLYTNVGRFAGSNLAPRYNPTPVPVYNTVSSTVYTNPVTQSSLLNYNVGSLPNVRFNPVTPLPKYNLVTPAPKFSFNAGTQTPLLNFNIATQSPILNVNTASPVSFSTISPTSLTPVGGFYPGSVAPLRRVTYAPVSSTPAPALYNPTSTYNSLVPTLSPSSVGAQSAAISKIVNDISKYFTYT